MAKPWYEQGQHQQRYWSYDSIHDFLYYAIAEVDKLCKDHNLHYYLAYGSVLGAVRDGGIIPWDPDADIYVPAQELKQFVTLARRYLPDDLYVDFYDINPDYINTSPKIGKKGFTTNGLHIDVFPLVGIPVGVAGEKFLRKYEWQRIWFGVIQGDWESRLPKVNRVCQNKWFRRSTRLLKKVLNKESVIEKMETMATAYSIFDSKNHVFDGFGLFQSSFFAEGKNVQFNQQQSRIPADSDSYLKQCYGDYQIYPSNRCFQSIIRSDYVSKEIQHQIVAFIDSFCNLKSDQFDLLEQLFWNSGSIVAIVDARNLGHQEFESAKTVAKSIKYFDKVLFADSDKSMEGCIKMIDADYVVNLQ